MLSNMKLHEIKINSYMQLNAFVIPLMKLKLWYPLLVKGTFSDLRQLLGTKSTLKMMKNAFYFTSKAPFLFKKSTLSRLFGHVAKWLDKNDKVNFKFYDVTTWLTNNCNTHIVQYLKK